MSSERETTPRGESRRRRSAEEARREILDAAQKRLDEGGPDALRLQDIARDVGISHPAILHHFGSRDGLIGALDNRAIRALTDDVARILEGGREIETVELIERVAQTMDKQGLAQLIAWWAMRGPTEGDGQIDPREIVGNVARLLQARALESDEFSARQATLEEVTFGVRLAVVAMFGDAILGDELSQVSQAEREAERHRFRAWLAQLLLSGLYGGPPGET